MLETKCAGGKFEMLVMDLWFKSPTRGPQDVDVLGNKEFGNPGRLGLPRPAEACHQHESWRCHQLTVTNITVTSCWYHVENSSKKKKRENLRNEKRRIVWVFELFFMVFSFLVWAHSYDFFILDGRGWVTSVRQQPGLKWIKWSETLSDKWVILSWIRSWVTKKRLFKWICFSDLNSCGTREITQSGIELDWK